VSSGNRHFLFASPDALHFTAPGARSYPRPAGSASPALPFPQLAFHLSVHRPPARWTIHIPKLRLEPWNVNAKIMA